VRAEAKGRIAEIRMELEDGLLEVIMRTRRRKFTTVLTYSDLGWIVSLSKNKHIRDLLNEIAKDIQDHRCYTPDQLPDILQDALNSYLADSNKSERQIISRINPGDISLWVRQQEYPTEKTALESRINNRNDVEILLDAHDLSVTGKITKLEFVTGDRIHIVTNSSHILSTLQLSGIRYLSTF
jgi:hypothetical protein